jgi:predicted nuclease with TOPRIM domain
MKMLNRSSAHDESFHITPLSQGSVTWAETLQMMNDLAQLYEKPDQSPIMLSIQESIHLQSKLEQRKELLLSESNEIKAQIQSATEKCSNLLQVETEKLKSHERNLDELQTELDRILRKRKDLQKQLDEVNHHIHVYSTEASQEIEGFDSVELERQDEVPRLKQQISLHATGTGIKWDFHRTDALVGEVSIPSRKVLKRFCVELNDHSSFEIANKVWDIMDASSS